MSLLCWENDGHIKKKFCKIKFFGKRSPSLKNAILKKNDVWWKSEEIPNGKQNGFKHNKCSQFDPTKRLELIALIQCFEKLHAWTIQVLK